MSSPALALSASPFPWLALQGFLWQAKKGILVREFSSFEQATTLDAVVFDKTGTITRGQWKLLKIIPTGPVTEEEALALAASLEQKSEHSIALELKNRAKQTGLDLVEPVA